MLKWFLAIWPSVIGLADGRKTILLITVNHNKSVQTLTAVKPLASCSGMSLAQPCSWAGQRPVWRYWVAPCCAAPAPKTTCEDSNITANHSLPQPGSTCKPHPLPAATQTESRGHTWHRHLLLRLCLLKTKPKRLSCMQSCRTPLTDTGTYTCHRMYFMARTSYTFKFVDTHPTYFMSIIHSTDIMTSLCCEWKSVLLCHYLTT